ncbi:MAG TPA: prolyl oligopeptidase family serine peptidase [Pyrinomonadaceae bacterium]|nr:prolyl oligopeptidase family serine peptidase [Pyrinomonadaceae bacterium]
MKSILSFIFIISFCFNPVNGTAGQSTKFGLTIDNIMRGAELVGYEPEAVRWSRDGQKVYFRWKRAGEPRNGEFSTYVVGGDGGGLRKLSEEEAKLAPPASGELSKNKKFTVFSENGDIFLYDHETGARRQITKTIEIETNPRFTFDQKGVYFTRQNNLYVLSLDGGGSLEQITDIRASGAPNPDAQRKGTESQETIKKEERALLDAIRERAEKRERDEAKRKEREKRKSFQLAPGQTAANLTLSPDGTRVIAVINESGTGAKNTIVPNYVTESAFTEDIPARAKVGDAQGRSRIAIIDAETGESKWVEHGRRVEVAPRIQTKTEGNATEQTAQQRGTGENQQQARQTTAQTQNQTSDAAARQQTETAQQKESPDREVQLFALQWSDDGKHAVIQARAADNKDRWIMLLDPSTGKTKVLATVHDDAWVGGPGASTLGWLPDNRRVYFQSERDGFAHLYTISIDGGAPVQLTSGKFEVFDVRLSEDKTEFYFTSSEGSFFERNLYSMSFDGGARTRLTSMAGNNQATVSPDRTRLAIVRSFSNKPPELYIAPNKTGASETEIKQITVSPIDEWRSFNWVEPAIVPVKARDGATVYARLYKPKNFIKGGAAVVFVHGAGYLQNVHKWWSNYYREYMFHHFLMEKGYAVLDIDYRGSAGYGRDWRTGIYRFMGGKDLTDHVDAARFLVDEHAVDAKRIGIYGGSYGGFITLMAMFTTPDVFAAGAALRPVTDWAHYNNGYTSNILNLPQNDLEAYKRSSPIYHAAGLKVALLICHGMVDVNVHFQDSVRLAQKLIELRKENWELAPYPVEDHAFEQPTSWADEYKRIFKLFETNLKPPVANNRGAKNKK